MLKLADKKIKILHLEPTDACNAACPQCARETNLSFDKTNLHHLTINQIKTIIDDEIIRNLDKMYMCGDFGDPAAGKNTLEIYQYFRNVNPNITLGMNTNGGLRNTNWWMELGRLMSGEKDYIVFSIDGLEDTNHIYRVNVEYNKVIKNACAFISAGGSAHWEMLVFDHNQHQIDQIEDTARQLGFKWFRAKVSRRFKQYPVEFLHPPKSWADPIVTEGTIECQALKESSLYISSRGIAHPCCWLGHDPTATIETFSDIQKSWGTKTPFTICSDTCKTNITGSSFTNQWQREVEFQK